MESSDEEAAARMVNDAFESFNNFGGEVPSLPPFGPDAIEGYLNGAEINFFKGKDGAFLFEMDTPHPYVLRFLLACEGEAGQVCAVRATAGASIPRAQWGRVAFACNEWMVLKRWPRAFLEIEDAATSPAADLVADGHHIFAHGATPEQVALLLRCLIGGAIDFFEWARVEKKLF